MTLGRPDRARPDAERAEPSGPVPPRILARRGHCAEGQPPYPEFATTPTTFSWTHGLLLTDSVSGGRLDRPPARTPGSRPCFGDRGPAFRYPRVADFSVGALTTARRG